MADIDLRPKQGDIIYELLRMGLVFDHVDNDGTYSFTRNSDNLVAEFKSLTASEVKLIDRTTTLFVKVTPQDLTDADAILTWQGKNPTLENGGTQ